MRLQKLREPFGFRASRKAAATAATAYRTAHDDSAVPAHRASEAGFTLIEMLVGVLMLSILMGTLMMPMMTSERIEKRDVNYAYAQQEARTGLDSMVSQIRQAYNILDTTANSIDFNIYLNSVAYRVYYECDVPQSGTSYRECVRLQVAAGSTLPPLTSGTVVIHNLTNGTTTDPVFTFAPDPAAPYYMTSTIKVPASDGVNGGLNHSIVFSDGALMRNENVGN
jgi:prepilin-type N-terminal cleavage/methylation domain-containing protein